MVRTSRLYSQSNCQGYNTVWLTLAITLHITSLELIHLIAGSLYPLTNISPFLPTLSPWQPPFYSLFLWVLRVSHCIWCRSELAVLIPWGNSSWEVQSSCSCGNGSGAQQWTISQIRTRNKSSACCIFLAATSWNCVPFLLSTESLSYSPHYNFMKAHAILFII